MSFVIAEVHDELFQGWLKETENNFLLMTETMIKVAEEIKKEVQMEFVPIETGKLSRSFKETILTDNSRMKVVEIQMSALNERTGYDYAMTQHRGYHISKNGQKVHYMRDKLIPLGFDTYSVEDGNYSSDSDYIGHIHKGSDKYMYWGIVYAKRSAFEIIETDYLSMFYGGFIV